MHAGLSEARLIRRLGCLSPAAVHATLAMLQEVFTP